ncbi:MAG: AAA family ATPase [Omnitrophica WOR_2 bacterium RIFCSPLOWO2_02_FULL_63_16]|nr:MAG: AAA family ATPase [Omnitrophica WOR_2 bacterium GWA2_63_20]OGX36380.1 MAG: AAA family ATPase [Omnitrophica WOR_2 bacterium RIFCSPHIGHO2_02_FULL_63_39]OGX44513.1 MAG: AAA family ATPase [Omnitrophica WOR_2 bacterium RIFCSPLOWO2_02_FULL_63_16]OGX50120.1 MAG: AAA family ATPase [Omnitrophica WOR_2 bacterium RIFCSPLOWO2_12_FULL_63_16]HBQ37975.1 AAA family ATPase [Candidatus Omnitrophota bacterium]
MSAALPMQPEEFRKTFHAIQSELSRVIVGQTDVLEAFLVAFFAGGHVLLEGVPGLGKTLLAKSFAKTLGLTFSRVQCTPDLMPADILGTQLVVDRDGRKIFEFAKGPVFTHILLADEINRATPKTQSALLEAMEERQVTIAGTTNKLDEPFFVIATQNPIEMAGTFPLPEAQLDRFLFRVFVTYPTPEELGQIIRQTTTAEMPSVNEVLPSAEAKPWMLKARQLVREVLVARAIEAHVVRLVSATHPHEGSEEGPAARWIRYGASPRGAQAILMGAKVLALVRGRVNISFEDVDHILPYALNHRLVLSFEAEAERRSAQDVLRDVLEPVRQAAHASHHTA